MQGKFERKMKTTADKICKQKAKQCFLEFVEDDYTEIWVLSEFLYDNLQHPTKEKVSHFVKEIISELMIEKNLVVIDVKTEKPAKLSKRQILSKIDLIFQDTKGKPTIGDGLWFDRRI